MSVSYCFVFHKMFKACILACDLGATTLSLLCKPEEQSSSVLSPGDDLIRSYCEFGRRHNELLLLMGSFPSHLVSRHLPISFETFLLMTPSSLFISTDLEAFPYNSVISTRSVNDYSKLETISFFF